ncbi:calcitonin gene-related peptide type 1 receptor-like [Poecilia reticulata]|nr:PREDICTED: calcitonin gene-related peptide type 1 receptor-like [Poecilia reticulata]XP_008410959.1 PREDICTED: calcitonin gene-related peptide type 1 receptor-like [Poecilia reticulata]XP_008410960.1 PREDICTED: calcitonin gene-related peptide type 1 receptor-like [Poecilia reticulata]XP_008410961.1 PREDICTED: calcitonin gene-related peptide type 1 receptor-like [Poecilia reticulata]
MWMSLALSLMAALALGTEVLVPQDVGSLDPAEKPADEADFSYVDFASLGGNSRPQILRAQYECYLKMIHEPLRTDEGPFCNRTWDGWMCWDDSAPGTSMQMCPSYFINFDPSETVTKICNPDGQWFHHPESKRVWSNYTLCSAHSKDKLKFTIGLYYLAMVGQGISIVSLIISLVIFSYLKSLSCQRISLHKNMFISFIFNSVFTMGWLSLVSSGWQTISAINPVICKILATLIQYTATSNYFWMLCEGIYLHTLIIVAVFVGEQQLCWYYILGWVFPIFPAITYAVARGFYFNDTCWISSDSHLVYIIHGPIHAALFVNLFFLLNVIRVLITKLRKTHCAESTAYMKAVRATLTLIPLLGVQHILFPWIPDIYDKQVIQIFVSVLSNFQGLLVSIILCFCNAEAQTALRRKWVQWKIAWGKTGLGETPFVSHHFNCHTTSSIVETSRATGSAKVPSHRQTETCHLMPVGQQKTG